MRNVFFAILAAMALAGCSDPLAGVERLSEVELAEDTAPIDFATEPGAEEADLAGEGFLSRVFGRAQPETDLAGGEVTETDQIEAAPESATEAPVAANAVEPEEPPVRRRGLFARLVQGSDADTPQTSALAPDQPKTPEPEALSDDRRLASRGDAGRDARLAPRAPRAAAEPDLPLGAPLAFGQTARACAATKAQLGRRIEKFPARGSGYALYDSAPGTTAPRSFFVTGFADGCPRRFTAANAVFGAPSMHEQLRYGLPGDLYPYSDTDKAYERIKSGICGVSRRKPCGARISRLERNTVFISAYERFGGGNPRWADILIHDGAVVAASVKAPQ
ncbi:hypothetical protein [Thalassococcus sp. S3]|uniref:hypothetical protein n=1 Tax=Thalassococcus sp. S3 TaxID=2017482 RepID=UPI0010247255|nr:hypothetical protein [Thalassococcus sp. S3]QBF33064.1 hypothetical protein CFI11_17810 [Thalassococcus sp. S3]